MSDFTPEWAAPILNSPINILTGAKCCINATSPHDSPSCEDCPFYPWYDCYRILQEQLDKLIEKENNIANDETEQAIVYSEDNPDGELIDISKGEKHEGY